MQVTDQRLRHPVPIAWQVFTTISLGEMIKGIELMTKGKRSGEIEIWFARLELWANSRLLAPTYTVMREWGRPVPSTNEKAAVCRFSTASLRPLRLRTVSLW